MSEYELGQLNIAVAKEPLESPTMKGFVENLDRINALAEQAPGFVWRPQAGEGDATALRSLGENVLVNMSVWKDPGSLHDYVYRSDHGVIMRRRKEWFERVSEAHMALWWGPNGHRPSVKEGVERLEHLREHGASPYAFTFRRWFPSPEDYHMEETLEFDEECAAT